MRFVTGTVFAWLLASVPSTWAAPTSTPPSGSFTGVPTTPAFPTIPPVVILPVNPSAYNNNNDPVGVCRTQCPSSLLCVGNHCVSPQPVCTSCVGNSFCDTPFNSTIIDAFNQGTLSGKITVTVNNNNGQVSVQVNPQFQRQTNINFTDVISHIHDGGVVDGICKSLQPVCNATSCGPRQVCAPFDGCRRCDACGDVDLTPLLNGNWDPSSIAQSWNITRGQGQGEAIGQGVLATIQAGINQFTNLTFGDDGGWDGNSRGFPRNGSCVAALAQNAIAQVDHLRSNIQDAAVQVANGAQLSARDISVLANTTLQFILAGDGARCGANHSISLNGSLVIRGSSSWSDVAAGISGGRFDFPADASNNTIGPNAIANIAGGVEITGDLGWLKASIAASGAAAGSCQVPKNTTLHSATDILGENGELVVRGAFNFSGHTHQPTLSIPDGGNVTIDVGRDGNFTCGHLNLTSGGHVDIHSNGNFTFFRNLTCELGATLRVHIDSIPHIRNSSIVLFTYSSLTAAARASFHCDVELYDGNITLTLLNPNNVAANRRLLADSGSVTWTANGATAQDVATDAGTTTSAPTTSTTTSNPTTPSGNFNSASHATPATLFTLAIIMIARAL